jgi:hypothetical protein
MNLCNEMEEQFKPIKGYEGLYEAGNLGSIKSLITNKILKPQSNPRGYYIVGLSINNKSTSKSAHRLVAETFILNLENKPQVNHINGIKNDNRIKNLEWVTGKENINHAIKMGLRIEAGKLIALNNIKTKSKQTLDLYTGIVFDSLKIACKSLNLNYHTQASRILKNNNNRLQYI